MRIALVTDAWFPQVNGVVRTLSTVKSILEERGHPFEVISPDLFPTIPCPSYPEIRLAYWTGGGIRARIEAFGAEAVHIATEGPLGRIARRYCLRVGRPFTTSYHTRFPEYIGERLPLPLTWSYAAMRSFHRPAGNVLVATESMRRELEDRRFQNLQIWSRGVDCDLFRPRDAGPRDAGPRDAGPRDAGPRDAGPREEALYDLPRPIFISVGRVAVEKNLQAFLDLDLPGSKVVVGDGPARAALEKAHPEVTFVGARHGEDLARHYAAADVFVFPSLTDTFGLVLLEAMASGLPVAAFPVTGPQDVIGQSGAGVLSQDLRQAALDALEIPRDHCRAYAERFSWEASAETFFSYLKPWAKLDLAA